MNIKVLYAYKDYTMYLLLAKRQFFNSIQLKNVYCHTNTVEIIQYINAHKEYNTYMPIGNTIHICQ